VEPPGSAAVRSMRWPRRAHTTPRRSADTGFRRALSRAIADRVNVREARLERPGLDRYISVLGHAAGLEHFSGRGSLGRRETRRRKTRGRHRGSPPGAVRPPTSVRGRRQRCLGRRRHRCFKRRDERDLAGAPDTAGREVVVHHQRRLAGGRRKFERRAADGDGSSEPIGGPVSCLKYPRSQSKLRE
jgi:hypothetical protein